MTNICKQQIAGILVKSIILDTKQQTQKPTRTRPYSTKLVLTKTVVGEFDITSQKNAKKNKN